MKTICKQCGQQETASEQNEYCEDCFAYNFLGEPDEQDLNDDDDWQTCDDCDLPDACEDFGCAIKHGLRKPPLW